MNPCDAAVNVSQSDSWSASRKLSVVDCHELLAVRGGPRLVVQLDRGDRGGLVFAAGAAVRGASEQADQDRDQHRDQDDDAEQDHPEHDPQDPELGLLGLGGGDERTRRGRSALEASGIPRRCRGRVAALRGDVGGRGGRRGAGIRRRGLESRGGRDGGGEEGVDRLVAVGAARTWPVDGGFGIRRLDVLRPLRAVPPAQRAASVVVPAGRCRGHALVPLAP